MTDPNWQNDRMTDWLSIIDQHQLTDWFKEKKTHHPIWHVWKNNIHLHHNWQRSWLLKQCYVQNKSKVTITSALECTQKINGLITKSNEGTNAFLSPYIPDAQEMSEYSPYCVSTKIILTHEMCPRTSVFVFWAFLAKIWENKRKRCLYMQWTHFFKTYLHHHYDYHHCHYHNSLPTV